MNIDNPTVLIGVFVGLVIAIRGLFRPFLGLLVLMTLHFVQPSEMIPALAPLRIELVYGILVFAILVFQKGSAIKDVILTDRIVRGTLLLEALVIFSIPFAIWPGGAASVAQVLLKMIILQLLISLFVDSQERLRYILWLLVSFLMWFAGSSFSAYLHGGFYTIDGVQRAEGINSMVGGPNELAGLLLALLPFLVALIHCSKQIVVKLLLCGCGALALFVFALTGARISMIALIALGIFYVVRSKRKLLSLAAVIAAGCLLWLSLPQEYQNRYLTVKQYAEGGELDASNKLRLQIWQAGGRMFLDHPILGVGPGQFPTAFGTIYSGNVHGAWMEPHSLLLQVTCELGLVGLGIFSYLVFQIWKANRWILRISSSAPPMKTNYEFATACSLMMIGIALISLVSHTLYRPYWYLLAGLVSANYGIAHRLSKCAPSGDPEQSKETEPRIKIPAGRPARQLRPRPKVYAKSNKRLETP
jgi:O-antigen ligase